MKKILVIMCFICLLTGCKKNKNTLVLVTEAGFAPYEYYEENNIVGVDVDIANEIAKDLNKKLVIKDVWFESIISELKTGKADFAAAGMSVTPERLKNVDFSIEYTTSRQVVVVNKSSNINSIDDIYDKKIAVQLGSVADLYFSDKYPKTNLVRQKKYLTMAEDLKVNKIDLIVMDELPAKEIVKNNSDLQILDGYVFEDSYGIAVKKGNKELLDNINKTLERLIKEDKISKFIIKHSK